MAYMGSLSRLASSALTSVRLGTLHSARIPAIANPVLLTNHDDLCTTFRKLNVSPLEAQLTAAVHSSDLSAFLHPNTTEYRLPSLVKPVSITVPSLYNGAILEKNLPPIPTITEVNDPWLKNEIQEAPSSQVVEKQAARLIVIRRKKMKKHKLKKLRKKMKFVWLKIIQRREYRKEKAFQAEQMAIVREGEAFDAAKYVEDVLSRTKMKPPQIYFRGKKLPEFIVKQLQEEHKIKRQKQKEHVQAIEEMMQEIKVKSK